MVTRCCSSACAIDQYAGVSLANDYAYIEPLKLAINRLSIKSSGVLADSLRDAGVVVREGLDKIIHGKRSTWMFALSLEKLAQFAIHVSVSKDDEEAMAHLGALTPAANDEKETA